MQTGERKLTETAKITEGMIELYDDYTHRTLDRRRFVERLSRLAGGSAAALAILPLLEADQAAAAIIADDDSRLESATVAFAAPGGAMSGYFVTPKNADGKLPAVLVIHENRGLNPHIEDVARRVALAGFVALAPDFLAPEGGTPSDPDQAREMIRALDGAATVKNAVASVEYLKNSPTTSAKVGAVGFCWGGAVINILATAIPTLDAGVAFYGRAPDSALVPSIRAKMLLHFAGLDERVNKGVPGYRTALDAAGVEYAIHMYDGVNHAFHNDTSAARYDKTAAELAWSRTIDFFKETLG